MHDALERTEHAMLKPKLHAQGVCDSMACLKQLVKELTVLN